MGLPNIVRPGLHDSYIEPDAVGRIRRIQGERKQ